MSVDDWDAAFAWADDGDAGAGGSPDDSQPFRVWRANWPALVCFLACSTQWRVGGMGGVIGLDYCGVEVVMRQHQVADQSAMFKSLQAMESAALEVLRHV